MPVFYRFQDVAAYFVENHLRFCRFYSPHAVSSEALTKTLDKIWIN